jgi:adenine-specific DNA-methyltransferase
MNMPVALPPDAYAYGNRTSGELHGVVLTKPHVVSLILDLAGYTSDHDLASLTLLEPSCGEGAFLIQAIERLIASAKLHGHAALSLVTAIRAYDIDPNHVTACRKAGSEVLTLAGIPPGDARLLVDSWITQADFLLESIPVSFDFVVGNPPYIRIEHLSGILQAEYRARYVSLFDRADLYVAFIERGLGLLTPRGVLSFVCADRWTLNKYGGPLRQLITERFAVRWYVDLHQASPFESEVIAYPAIFAIGRERSAATTVATFTDASVEECDRLATAAATPGRKVRGLKVSRYKTWFSGEEPWVLSSPAHLEVLRDLERRFEPIEANGRARVGIGVATGNDQVYIVNDDTDIEPDRLVPLVMRGDIDHGTVQDGRRFVINTFGDDGRVVDLVRFPKLAAYLAQHDDAVRRRHVSQRNLGSWFRTIDRVYPELVSKPKLLIPDIAGSNEVVFEAGHFHPHHNLYFVTSEVWDLEVLGGILSSKVALFFVWSYAVKMRGGYLRFQAQYLRRIRLPDLRSLSPSLTKHLRNSFRNRDFQKLDALALKAYNLETLPLFEFVDTRR